MNEYLDRLTETFESHEHLAPNPAEVLEKANLRARSYRRRRRAAQATGASVLGAGLVAGGVALPGLKSHPGGGSAVSQTLAGIATPIASPTSSPSPVPSPAASAVPSAVPSPLSSALPSPVPSVSGSPGVYTQQQMIDAFIADGYDYDNATALGSIWNETDITQVKAKAGLRLLMGDSLPVTPNSTPETTQEKDVDAYFAGGYDYNDATMLASLWHQTDINQVKADAGAKLLAGLTLPVAANAGEGSAASPTPGQPDASAAVQAAQLAAYFAAGYGYDNAVTLSGLWHETDIGQVKAEAGQKLLAGQTLPVAPTGASPTAS
jgi:hypothetical protein